MELITAVELLVVATAVAMLAQYVRLPYTVALVLGGLAIGLALPQVDVVVSKDLILLVLLPPLLFEGTVNMDLSTLRDRGWLVFLLAIPGTLISSVLVGAGLHYAFSLDWPVALLLGVMVTPTDPVSVITVFRQQGVSKGLATIIEGESVFNDGIGVTLYLVLLGLVEGGEVTLVHGVNEFLVAVVGGAAVGLVLGYAAYRVFQRLDDHLLEVMVSLVLAYGAYLVAERFHASGVIAVVVVGLIVGNFARTRAMSPTTRVTLGSFWEVAAFLANSIVFLLIGLVMEPADLAANWRLIAGTVLFMLAARSAVVYGAGLAARAAGMEFPLAWQHVANWGGLKGSIPIALAIGLPAGLTQRAELVSVVIGVVAFSLFVQGLTFKPLLDRLGVTRRAAKEAEYERLLARSLAVRAGLRELREVQVEGLLPSHSYARLQERLKAEEDDLTGRINGLVQEHDVLRKSQETAARRRVLLAQRAALDEAVRRGIVAEEAMVEVREEIDVALAGEEDAAAVSSPEEANIED